ncbi:MAG: hypothetical protein M3O50_09560 [Myxococcota bacterium]|nr:hypothetical protein [Myxococcota bacterium]
MAEPRRRALGEGAAQAAPTAPHATPRANNERRTGPERFWARGPVRTALALAVVVSVAAHCSVLPFGVARPFEVHEVEGEAAIPVDLLDPGSAPPLEPESSSKPTEPPNGPPLPGDSVDLRQAHDTPLTARDAGSARDSSDRGDASVDALSASSSPAERATSEADADSDANLVKPDLDGAVAFEHDAAVGSRGPRDPEAILGAAGAVQADVVLVMLVMNAEVIRKSPVGARLGFLLRALPQWDDFVRGTDVDPVRDVDWMIISGPSLLNTSRDVVLIRYSAADAVVDRAIAALARRAEHGGAFDAGVRGVKAVLARADRADRVILRTQAHVLAVVPPSVAQKVARQLAAAPAPAHVRPGEAVYLRLVDPHHPMPEIPESLKELRLRVVPRDDGGADVYVEGDTTDSRAAGLAAEELKHVIRRHNDGITSLVTGGILDRVDIHPEGNQVELHLIATRAQIERLADLAGDFLGVSPPPVGPTTSPERPSAPNGARAGAGAR